MLLINVKEQARTNARTLPSSSHPAQDLRRTTLRRLGFGEGAAVVVPLVVSLAWEAVKEETQKN